MGQISGKEFVKDIRNGLSDEALKKKYNVSDEVLRKFFIKSVDSGIITQEEIEKRSQFYKCPSCEYSSADVFEECPQCGIVLAKFKSKQKNEPSEDNDFDSESDSSAAEEDQKYKGCPYCGEHILKIAKKCKHCGEFLEEIPILSNGEASTGSESVIWEDKPSHLSYLFLYIIGSFITLILAVMFHGKSFFVVGILLIIWAVLNRKMTKYTVTKRKITSERGIISRDVREIEIKDIRNINYKQNIIESLFGIGTIAIGTAGTAGIEVAFKGISNPKKIQEMLGQLKTKVAR